MFCTSIACLIYSRGLSLGSPLIRAADRWGRWSHCGVVLQAEAVVVEARAFHGVVRTPLEAFERRVTHCEQVQIPVPDCAAGAAWLEQQLGKGYDYGGVAGNLFRADWHSPRRHHCANLVEAYLHACGLRRWRVPLWRLSPNLSWMVM